LPAMKAKITLQKSASMIAPSQQESEEIVSMDGPAFTNGNAPERKKEKRERKSPDVEGLREILAKSLEDVGLIPDHAHKKQELEAPLAAPVTKPASSIRAEDMERF